MTNVFQRSLDGIRKRPAIIYWMCFLGILIWILARRFGVNASGPPVYFVPLLGVMAVVAGNLVIRKFVSLRMAKGRHRASMARAVTWFFVGVDFLSIIIGLRLSGGQHSPLWVVTFVVVTGETILEGRLVAGITRVMACIAVVAGTLLLPMSAKDTYSYSLEMFVRLGLIIAVSSVVRRLRVQAEAHQAEISALKSDLLLSDERTKLSREIHDGIGNTLAATVLRLELIGKLTERSGDSEGSTVLREEAEVIRTSMNQIRDWTFFNQPWADDAPLSDVIVKEVTRWSRRTGITVTLSGIDLLNALHHCSPIAILRIIQESLTNVVKHARGADTVCIGVTKTRHHVALQIDDNGEFVSDLEASSSGLGITSMIERAKSIGGDLISKAGPTGMQVTLTIPLVRSSYSQFAE